MDEVLKLLGLVYRAKKMEFGEEVLNNIRDIKLIFLASDLSSSSKQRFLKKCDYYNIPHVDTYNSDELANSVGKKLVKVIGIKDEGFKKTLLSKMK